MDLLRNIFSSKTIWIAIVAVFVANFLASSINWKWDFTEDQKYSLSDNTKGILESVVEPIHAEILLAGDFDKGPARLQQATEDMLRSFQSINGKLRYDFNDPFDGPEEAVREFQKELFSLGINPTNFTLPDGEELRQRAAYAYVVFFKGDQTVPVEILESQGFGGSDEATINESIALLEYKFATAVQRLSKGRKPLVYFTQGQGELVPFETYEFAQSASQFFQIGNLHLDSTNVIDSQIDILVVAKPLERFTESDLFKIDQYIMRGGKVVWMVEQLGVTLDSLRGGIESFLPRELDLGLDPLLFKYGIKVNKSLVVDTECTDIRLNTGNQGGQPKFENFKYYYHLVPDPNEDHIIGGKLDRVNMLYAGSIDTLKTKLPLDRTVLLKSSANSFEQSYPMQLDFEIQKLQTEFEKFDDGGKVLGLLQEGEFASYFANRPPPFETTEEVIKSSSETAMVIISDGDLIRNSFRAGKDGQPVPIPLGFNRNVNYQFDNKAFFDNVIAYLLGEGQVLAARKKNLELRLLNKAKIDVEKTYWQWFNIGLPLLLLGLLAIINGFIRKKKYAS